MSANANPDANADAVALWRAGNLLLANGSCDEAVASYRQSLALEPRNIRALNNLGQACMLMGRLADAVAHFQQAVALEPSYSIAHYNCAIALLLLNRPSDALLSLTQALLHQPDFVEALVSRGDTLQQLRRFSASLADYEMAVRLRPENADALCNWANALLELKRAGEALACCERALALRPDFPEAHNNRAGALRELHRLEEAVAACDRALALRPDYVDALCNRGRMLREMGDHLGARESFRGALRLNPDQPDARLGFLMSIVPALPANDDEVRACRAAFASELERFIVWTDSTPDMDETAVVGASQPFFLAYDESSNRDMLVRYGDTCSALMGRWHQRNGLAAPIGDATSGGKIRVGIVSAQVREHAVYRALTKGWLSELRGHDIEVGVFHLGHRADTETEWAKDRAAFYLSGDRTLVEWVQAIKSATPDVLIYPELGMDPTTLRLASLRLVQHQLVAWGHPETSGLPTVDHYLSADAFEPPDAQALYSEHLMPLPNLGCYYEPHDLPDAVIDVQRLGIRSDRPLLLCPGTPFKYAPRYDRVLVAIARRLGRCQLVFFESPGGWLSGLLRRRLESAFRTENLEPSEYLVFVPWQTPSEFFALLRRADVCLDTMGFSGFNTALQAIECDLPVVAYEGRFMRGRLASGILKRMGLQDLVTRDESSYVSLAVRLASDAGFRHAARVRLRASKHVLFRDREAIEGLAKFLTGLRVS
jgi:predicted O-linked N-acetylglucosamine transferase (SPINDLY family)